MPQTAERRALRALIVEDSEPDAELLLHELRRGGYDVTFVRVETAETMQEALQSRIWDVVLSDYSLPTFNAPAALALLRRFNTELPFVIVSGTIGEETAVSALKAGACDFLVKGRLARLIPALQRELREVELRRQRAHAQAALEEQLRQAQKMEAVGQLAGGIAHDFNNLLTAILGYCELLTDQIGPDKPVGQDLREIMAAAQRASALTRQLLAFSRKQVLTVAALDLNQVVRNMEGMLGRLIGEHITIRTTLAGDLHPVIADATQLEQVLMNLAVNARDAMTMGGDLTIHTWNARPDEENPLALRVSLSVTDTGSGIPPDVLTKIFEPFFTTKERGRGTGLGLAAVHGIVSQLGGAIDVQSRVGEGTTFRVDLPATSAPIVQREAVTSEAAPVGIEGILLVEDEGGVRAFTMRALRRFGYEVLESDSAESAMALAAQTDSQIDLLITDVVLPRMGGRHLAEELTKARPHLRVLFMSGYSEEITTSRGFLEPGVQLLEKPFTARALLTKVRQVLESEAT